MDDSTKNAQCRKKRIAKIKKVIIIFAFTLIIIPIILCFLLFVKVSKLENKINDLMSYTQSASIGEQKAGVSGLPAKGEDKVTNVKITDDPLNNEILDTQEISTDISTIITNENEKKVYLTFDDGPSDNTDLILDILAKYKVKATFFVIEKTDEASIKRYKRILNEGHTLAMHSSSHIYTKIYESIETYIQDVTEIQNFLFDVTGYKPTIYRFPGGSSNTVSKISIYSCVSYLDEMGITYFDWNISSGDAVSTALSTESIINNVITGVEQEDNAVVLFHDANNKMTTVEALPSIIEQITDMGAKVLPITDKTTPVHHKISK